MELAHVFCRARIFSEVAREEASVLLSMLHCSAASCSTLSLYRMQSLALWGLEYVEQPASNAEQSLDKQDKNGLRQSGCFPEVFPDRCRSCQALSCRVACPPPCMGARALGPAADPSPPNLTPTPQATGSILDSSSHFCLPVVVGCLPAACIMKPVSQAIGIDAKCTVQVVQALALICP